MAKTSFSGASFARRAVRAGLVVALGFAWFTPPGHADAPAGRYSLPGNQTVIDEQTDLVWQQSDDGLDRSWESAESYCEDLLLAGGGWRLPSVKELLSLVDDSRSNPALDGTAFPGAANTSYWSGTAQLAGGKWFVYFPYGNLSWSATSTAYRVRCVR